MQPTMRVTSLGKCRVFLIEPIETYLRQRIKQLNEADAAFCKDRWDMNQPEIMRKMAREHSNAVTLARQELESCLNVLGLPRFLEPESAEHSDKDLTAPTP